MLSFCLECKDRLMFCYKYYAERLSALIWAIDLSQPGSGIPVMSTPRLDWVSHRRAVE